MLVMTGYALVEVHTVGDNHDRRITACLAGICADGLISESRLTACVVAVVLCVGLGHECRLHVCLTKAHAGGFSHGRRSEIAGWAALLS